MSEDSCDFTLTGPVGPQHVMYNVYFQTNNAGRACWLWSIWRDGHQKCSGSKTTMAECWDAAGRKMAELLKIESLPSYIRNAEKTTIGKCSD